MTMTEALSQDELDALLSNFGDDDSGSGDDFPVSGDDPVSADPSLSEIYNAAAEAFRNGAEGLGVMLAAASSFSKTGEETFRGSDASSKFNNDGLIIELPLQSPVSGSIYLRLSEDQAKSLIATATSTDSAEITFSEDQAGTAAEIINPALVAVTKAWSGRIRSAISTGQTAAYTLTASNPFDQDAYHEISGRLTIEGILDDTASLIIPAALAEDIKNHEAPAETVFQSQPEAPADSPAAGPKPYSKNNLNLLLDVQMPLTVELGRTKMYVKEILSLGEGSILELDKLASEPVDLMVNAKLIAKGEVIVIDENFGVRVTDIVSPGERLRMGLT